MSLRRVQTGSRALRSSSGANFLRQGSILHLSAADCVIIGGTDCDEVDGLMSGLRSEATDDGARSSCFTDIGSCFCNIKHFLTVYCVTPIAFLSFN